MTLSKQLLDILLRVIKSQACVNAACGYVRVVPGYSRTCLIFYDDGKTLHNGTDFPKDSLLYELLQY